MDSTSTTFIKADITVTSSDNIDKYAAIDEGVAAQNVTLIPGDIIFEYWELIKIDDIDVDHAALYIGDGKIVEADPHMDKWPHLLAEIYKVMEYVYHTQKRKDPSFQLGKRFKKLVWELQNKSYSGDIRYGNVEEDGFGEVYSARSYSYGRVYVDKERKILPREEIRKEAVNFAKERASLKWPLIDENGKLTTNHSRPFDYVSAWIKDDKQYDEYTVEMVLNNPSLARTLNYGYGCSELVWAAWWYATHNNPSERKISLDSDDSLFKYVWPWEIKNSPHVDIFFNSTGNSTVIYDTFQPVDFKLVYANKQVYAYNVSSLEVINGRYYLKTTNNEFYPLDNLTDLEVIQQNI